MKTREKIVAWLRKLADVPTMVMFPTQATQLAQAEAAAAAARRTMAEARKERLDAMMALDPNGGVEEQVTLCAHALNSVHGDRADPEHYNMFRPDDIEPAVRLVLKAVANAGYVLVPSRQAVPFKPTVITKGDLDEAELVLRERDPTKWAPIFPPYPLMPTGKPAEGQKAGARVEDTAVELQALRRRVALLEQRAEKMRVRINTRFTFVNRRLAKLEEGDNVGGPQ